MQAGTIWAHHRNLSKPHEAADGGLMQKKNGRVANAWHFTREFLRDPQAIGAVVPSSPFLARRMASLVPPGPGAVLELGPGMGPVTAALLESGVKPAELILVERSPPLAQHLCHRFPGVEVLQGDAADLQTLLAGRAAVRAVVSSLPLRSMPREVVQRILQRLPAISRPGTVFIQFTYHFRSSCRELPAGFERGRASVVWRNLPPARVDAFTFRAPI